MMTLLSPRLLFSAIVAVSLGLMTGCDQKDAVQQGAQDFNADNFAQPSGPPLPDLDLAALDERPVSLVSYMGQPVVLNLWATWCPPCRREMPVFEQAQAEFP